MKPKGIALFSMVILALALMALIVVAQFFTNQSTNALNKGNVQAVETFTINSRIQDLVNLSFELQSKFSRQDLNPDIKRSSTLKDSLIMLGYNSVVLEKFVNNFDSAGLSGTIANLVDSQANLSLAILSTYQSADAVKRSRLMDSLKRLNLGDQVYRNCQKVQVMLEKNLFSTLSTNSVQSGKLSTYNKVLAMFAIVAVLIMATIIIRRQSQQLKLIDDLKTAEMAALKSKNAKDEFLANMSHELRTPLNALIGFGNLLNDTQLNKQQKEYVDIIRSSGYNLLNVVNDVLDLSKIEAGKLKISNKPFNLHRFFEGLERMFSRGVQEKHLYYTWQIEKTIPAQLIGDPERLQQIFVNLIGNAIKFTNNGGIQVNAATVWADDENNFLKIGFTVKDTGIGIPKNKIHTIFERFEQLEHGSRREHGGTGLGLTIVKNLVERMGGSISVYSELDEGSEFNFTCVFENAGAIIADDEKVITTSNISFKNHQVLAVEDNKANQMLLKHLLIKYGLQPTIIDNGEDAIEILKDKYFDMVLMDIQMPKMDGYTAIGIIRNQLKLNNMPVIAMTAYVSENEIAKCYKLGFTDYQPKPVDEKSLIETIAKYLNSKSATSTGQPNNNDLSFLKELVGGDDEVINDILNEMKEQWSTDKDELIKASHNYNSTEIYRILHRVKSTFSPLGPQHAIYQIIHNESGNIAASADSESLAKCESFVKKIDVALQTIL